MHYDKSSQRSIDDCTDQCSVYPALVSAMHIAACFCDMPGKQELMLAAVQKSFSSGWATRDAAMPTCNILVM